MRQKNLKQGLLSLTLLAGTLFPAIAPSAALAESPSVPQAHTTVAMENDLGGRVNRIIQADENSTTEQWSSISDYIEPENYLIAFKSEKTNNLYRFAYADSDEFLGLLDMRFESDEVILEYVPQSGESVSFEVPKEVSDELIKAFKQDNYDKDALIGIIHENLPERIVYTASGEILQRPEGMCDTEWEGYQDLMNAYFSTEHEPLENFDKYFNADDLSVGHGCLFPEGKIIYSGLKENGTLIVSFHGDKPIVAYSKDPFILFRPVKLRNPVFFEVPDNVMDQIIEAHEVQGSWYRASEHLSHSLKAIETEGSIESVSLIRPENIQDRDWANLQSVYLNHKLSEKESFESFEQLGLPNNFGGMWYSSNDPHVFVQNIFDESEEDPVGSMIMAFYDGKTVLAYTDSWSFMGYMPDMRNAVYYEVPNDVSDALYHAWEKKEPNYFDDNLAPNAVAMWYTLKYCQDARNVGLPVDISKCDSFAELYPLDTELKVGRMWGGEDYYDKTYQYKFDIKGEGIPTIHYEIKITDNNVELYRDFNDPWGGEQRVNLTNEEEDLFVGAFIKEIEWYKGGRQPWQTPVEHDTKNRLNDALGRIRALEP